MDFLKLCQTLNTECGITGATQPSSVTNQNDILNHIVNWVRTADYNIQNLYFDWDFLWGNTVLNVAANAIVAIPKADTKHIDTESLQLTDGSDLFNIDVIDYKSLRNMRSLTQTSRPYVCAISPKKMIEFPNPTDKSYQIYYEYYKKPVYLEHNTDISLIPEEYQRCIILQAKLYYAERFSISEVAQEASKQYKEYFDRLRADQLPGLNHMRTIQPEFMTVVVE